jgi:uncharacterized protein YoxC
MEFSDGLAVAAIALALSTIFLGVLFYRWQTEQGREITRTVNDFAKEMHAVLGEIKGLTTGTREQLQEQFKFVLDRAFGRGRASLAEDVAQRLEVVERAFADLSARAGAESEAELAADIGTLKERVASLSSELSAVAKKAAEPAEPRVSSAQPRRATLLIRPKRTRVGGKVGIRVFGATGGVFARTTCEVSTPQDETFAAEFPGLTAGPLVFPDDFEEASSDVAGLYEVAVLHTNTLDLVTVWAGPTLLCTGSFVLEGDGQP